MFKQVASSEEVQYMLQYTISSRRERVKVIPLALRLRYFESSGVLVLLILLAVLRLVLQRGTGLCHTSLLKSLTCLRLRSAFP